MGESMATDAETVEALKANFKYHVKFWKSGNFVGYAATNTIEGLTTIKKFFVGYSPNFDPTNVVK
jgi:hypothetical protein